jgi:hypothetical protein
VLSTLAVRKYKAPHYGSKVWRSFNTGVGNVFTAAAATATALATNGGYCKFTDTAHGLVVGDLVFVSGNVATAGTPSTLNTVHRVTAKDANTFTTDVPYVASSTPGDYQKFNTSYGFATMTAQRYVIYGPAGAQANWIAGVASTTLRSGGSDYGIRRSIHRLMNAFRHDGAATAIRANYWKPYTGKWTTAPTATNTSIGNIAGSTVTDGTADTAATVNGRDNVGELVYRTGSPAPTQGDYPAKTG